MAVVVYSCDTCKRSIEKKRNPDGLEIIQRCIITQGCRGKLYQSDLLEDFIRGKRPSEVIGLDNWLQRKALFNFVNSIASISWEINHNLGVIPSVQVFVDTPTTADPDLQTEILPLDIDIVDKDNLILTFDRQYSGIAQLIANTTESTMPKPTTPVVVASNVQITNNGELTIATLDDEYSSTFDLHVQYQTKNGIISHTYSVDDTQSVDSPWVDYTKVIIQGKKYLVRSFNVVISEMNTGVINNGSTFHLVISGSPFGNDLVDVNGKSLKKIYILLANDPFAIYDKITNKFIDCADLTFTNFSVFVDSGELFSVDSLFKTIYPIIVPTN